LKPIVLLSSSTITGDNKTKMTMGIMYPPRLRSGIHHMSAPRVSRPCDPAEVDTFTSKRRKKSSDNRKESRSSKSNRRGSKKVFFLNKVTVLEVERVPKNEAKGVWWTTTEMERFRAEASKSKERRRRGIKRSANASGHSQKILLQQRASEELDGIQSDPEFLATVATQSSKKCRETAFKIADELQKEIENEVYSNLRKTLPILLRPKNTIAKEKPTIVDFYWGAVFETFADTISCGISSI